MGENAAESKQQSFSSKLRQRFGIIFTIGLSISVASFVENLQMGKDAVDAIVEELAQIRGLEDIVRGMAALMHSALDWWRVEIVQRLLTLLHLDIPVWLHDPLSLMFFATARVLNAVSRKVQGIDDPMDVDLEPGESVVSVGYSDDDDSGRYARSTRYWAWAMRARHIVIFYVTPLTVLMVLDRNFYDAATHRFHFDKPLTQPEVIFYALLLVLLFAALSALSKSMWAARKAAEEALRTEDGNLRVTRTVVTRKWVRNS